jgi:hypothetical protein
MDIAYVKNHIRKLEPVESNQLDEPRQQQDTNLPPNRRFMAMVNVQDPCPSSTNEQWSQYTDILLAFTTTHQDDGTCSETCEVATELLVCNNQPNEALLQKWNTAGKNIWIVFGGPGMGTNFDLVVPVCWEFCFGRQTAVVDSLATLVEANSNIVNGVVLSYQYLYQDDENGSGFPRGEQALSFVREITTGLRERLDDDISLAHMPIDGSVVVGTPYFALMAELAHTQQFDLIMPQYFNGVTRPVSNTNQALQHFDTLATFMFRGDPTRIVFGLCNNGADENCGGSEFSADSVQGAGIMKALTGTYPCHGGAFFWSMSSDPGGFWSTPLLQELTPTVEATECAIEEEPNGTDSNPGINDNEESKDDQYCQGLNSSSCGECIDNGCAWCNADGVSSCLSKSNTTVQCSLVCNPTAPAQEEEWTSTSLIEHHVKLEGLTQEYYGITELLTESRQALEELHGRHVQEFFSSMIDSSLILDSNITIVEVMLPSLYSRMLRRAPGKDAPRRLQNGGSSVVVVYDQEISYWYPVVDQMLPPDTLSAVPFTTEMARQDLTAMLQSSNDETLQKVLAVSEVLVVPQAPTESPVVPPVTTPVPTTPIPTNAPVLDPTIAPMIPSEVPPVFVPTIDSSPGSGPTGTGQPMSAPTSPPMNAPTPMQPSNNDTPSNPPVLEVNPPQLSLTPPPIQSPVFNTDPPMSLPTPIVGPPLTNSPVLTPTSAPVPAPTPNPTNAPTPVSATPAPIQNPQSMENAATKDDNDYPIFGKYTGFIVVAIVFVGLLAIFTIRMKWFMGEYVDE